MKRVWFGATAAVLGLALLVGKPTFGDDKNTDKPAASTPAAGKTDASKAAPAKTPAVKTPAGKKAHHKTASDKAATNKTADKEQKHTANKPVAGEASHMKALEQASRHRLPSGWGKLDVNPDQKTKIYGVMDKYSPQIKRLQAELQAAKDGQNAEMMGFLTSQQKTKLLEAQGTTKRPNQMAESTQKKSKDGSASASADANGKPAKHRLRLRRRSSQADQTKPQQPQADQQSTQKK